jgi:hypothetical protein
MAVVTGLTKERMLAMEAETVIAGFVDVNGHLLLEKRSGEQIDAGSVIGPQGPLPPEFAPGAVHVTDLNLAKLPGYYWADAAALNNPAGNIVVIRVQQYGDVTWPRIFQEIFIPSEIPARLRQGWRRTFQEIPATWSSWARFGEVANTLKNATAIASSGGTTPNAWLVDGYAAWTDVNTVRLTNLFLGDGDDGDQFAVYEFFWYILNAPATAAASFFIGLAGGTTARTTLKSTFTQTLSSTTTTVVGGSASDTGSPIIMGDITAALTGAVVHGYVYHAHSTAERTKIEFTVTSDSASGLSSQGMILNSAITVDDGLRFGSNLAARVQDGRLYAKRIM